MLDMFNKNKIISNGSYNSGDDRYMRQCLDTCMLVCLIRSRRRSRRKQGQSNLVLIFQFLSSLCALRCACVLSYPLASRAHTHTQTHRHKRSKQREKVKKEVLFSPYFAIGFSHTSTHKFKFERGKRKVRYLQFATANKLNHCFSLPHITIEFTNTPRGSH